MASLFLNRSRQAPAEESPAFAGIAERFRRAGDLDRSIALCRDGLRRFPSLLSARVTLGWALLDKGQYDEARVELEHVLRRAPDNLAAIRGLAELHERAESTMSSLDNHAHWEEQQEPEELAPIGTQIAQVAKADLPAPAEDALPAVAAAIDLPAVPEFTNSAGMAMAPAAAITEEAPAPVQFSVDVPTPVAFVPVEDLAAEADNHPIPFEADVLPAQPSAPAVMPVPAVEDIDFGLAPAASVTLEQLASAFEDGADTAPSFELVAEECLTPEVDVSGILDEVAEVGSFEPLAELPLLTETAAFATEAPPTVASEPMVTSLPSHLEEEDPPTLEIMASSVFDLSALRLPGEAWTPAAQEAPLLATTPELAEEVPAPPIRSVVDVRALRVAALEQFLRKVQRRRTHLGIGSVA